MEQTILHFVGLLGHWGYLLIFLAAFLESAALIGLFFPGETIVVVSGILASQHYLALTDCLVVVSLGALLGDSSGFLLGKNVGRGYFERHRRLLLLKRTHLARVNAYFEQHGGKTVFFGRFIGFLRALAPFSAGMAGMHYNRFIRYNAPGALLWSFCFTLLGYFFGESWHVIERRAGKTGLFVFLLILAVSGFGYLYRLTVKNKDRILAWGADVLLAPVAAVTRFAQRHERLSSFIVNRFSPARYLGLHLTLGLVLCSLFGSAFGFIIETLLTGTFLGSVDSWVAEWFEHMKSPSVTAVMRILAYLGSPQIVWTGMACGAFIFFARKRIEPAISFCAAVIGSFLLLASVRTAVRRLVAGSIPDAAFSVWIFPSGSVVISTVFYGMLAYFLVRERGTWQFKMFIVAATGFTIFLIGASGLYLETDFFSDVLGGFAGGLFWVTFCVTGHEVYQQSKSMKDSTALKKSG